MRRWMKEQRKKRGFTLVEIIAVLVILAILTAVAVPRFFSLADTAKNKSLQGAVAEGKSVCSLAYAQESLKASGQPVLANVVNAASSATIEGDFTYAFAASGSDIQITVAGKAGTPVSGVTTNVIWNMP